MSEPRESETPISYAQPGEPIILAKPFVMLPGNLAGVVMIFMKLIGYPSPSPFGHVVVFVKDVWLTHKFSGQFMDAMASTPFLLSIPLAAWTVRLCFNPITKTSELAIVYSLSAASMTMTVLALGYCTIHLFQEPRFFGPLAVGVVVMAMFLFLLWNIRGLHRTYLPALVAMTGALVTNMLLVMSAVLSHSVWVPGLAVGLVIGVTQLWATARIVQKYRGTAALLSR